MDYITFTHFGVELSAKANFFTFLCLSKLLDFHIMNVSIAPLMKWSLLPVMAFVLTLSACTTTITTHVDPAPAATPVRVLTKEACMRGGWRTLRVEGQTFRNQGQCVSYFATRR